MHIRMPLISAYNEYKYFITYKINLFYYLLLLSQFYRFVSDWKVVFQFSTKTKRDEELTERNIKTRSSRYRT